MKRTFITLLVSAVAVWGYVLVQLVWILVGKVDFSSEAVVEEYLPKAAKLMRAHPPMDSGFRDPFESYLYAQKPAPPVSVKSAAPKQTLKVIEPPRAKLQGILSGAEPVAILILDGKTELVKVGAVVWDLKVIKIERNQVVVVKEGRQFILDY